MQTALPWIWTRVAGSISYNDNHLDIMINIYTSPNYSY